MPISLTKHLCVSIPHGGMSIPREIDPESLSDGYQDLVERNMDHFTRNLYNFTELLDNRQVAFQYSSVLINVNRHPAVIDECVPVTVDGVSVYKEGFEPSVPARKGLAKTYHRDFHRRLARIADKALILDGHSMYRGHTDDSGNIITEDIIVANWQHSKYELETAFHSAPQYYLEIYIENLQKRLPGLIITANTKYFSTYGHVMAFHGWDGGGDRGRRTPLLLQETSENLYMKDGVPVYREIEHLRRTFAEALEATLTRVCDFKN